MADLCSKFLEAKQAKGLRPESLRLLSLTLDQFNANDRGQAQAAIQLN